MTAILTTEDSAYGRPVLALDDGTALGPLDVLVNGYELLDATPDERTALSAAGYDTLVRETPPGDGRENGRA